MDDLKLEQEQEQELAAQAAAKPAKAPAALETVTTPGTAEARTLWAATLDLLKQELPRSTFETWLRPTEGHSVQGNDLTVLVASPHNAEWLEQRVYQTILRAAAPGVRPEAGCPLRAGAARLVATGGRQAGGRRGCTKPQSPIEPGD